MDDYPRLLVIDFDYFFPNPLMMAKESRGNAPLLYDWSISESLFTAVDLWPQRAASFLIAGKELPRCNEGYEEFWNRFAFEGNPVFVSDSNVYAGIVDAFGMGFSEDAWSDVWLFDAHHDCYGSEEGFNPDAATCANWMHAHHRNGSKLHVRYPAWRADVDGSIVECEAPPGIPVDRQIDDGMPMGFFDQIMICRSGAWVPSWCDDQFEEFIHIPGIELGWIEETIPRDRKFSMKAAEKEAELIRRCMKGTADDQS